jgi:RNA methyltransferase, TrmH family
VADRVSWPAATHAQVALLADLALARGRREQGCCLVEGEVLLGDALAAGLVPRLVAVGPSLSESAQEAVRRAAERGAAVVLLSERAAARLSDREQAPGLLAAVPLPPRWDGQSPASGPLLLLVLCGLQDPGNVGTLLRSALAFGARAVLLLPGTADALGPKVVRASAGAALRLPVGEVEADALAALAQSHVLQLVGAQSPRSPQSPQSPTTGTADAGSALPPRCLLLIGHETRGLPALDGLTLIGVPHEPQVESLNAAMAGSILMADWYRRHRATGPTGASGASGPTGGRAATPRGKAP